MKRAWKAATNWSKVGSSAADAYLAINQRSAVSVRKDAAVSTFSDSAVEALTYERILKTQLVTVARDVSWPVKDGGFAFFNDGEAMTVKADGLSVSVSVAMSKDPLDKGLRVSRSGVRGRDVVREEAWVRGVLPSGASSRRSSGSWIWRVRSTGSFATAVQSCWDSGFWRSS